MDRKKGSHFWSATSSLTKITKMINEKRVEIKVNPYAEESGIIFHSSLSKRQNLLLLKKYLTFEEIAPIFTIIFEDMYKYSFESYTSVESKIQQAYYSDDDLNLLSEINLLEHTLGVLNEMILITEKTYNQFLDFYLLAALVHDAGKCSSLRNAKMLSNEFGHHKASADYLKQIVDLMRTKLSKKTYQTLNIVISAIRVHHDHESIDSVPLDKEKENKKVLDNNAFQKRIIKILGEADSNQRDKELPIGRKRVLAKRNNSK